MLVTEATFQPRMSPYFVVAVVGLVVQFDTAELMLPLVMGVTLDESGSSSSSNNNNTAHARHRRSSTLRKRRDAQHPTSCK
jgi:hypothetical protein